MPVKPARDSMTPAKPETRIERKRRIARERIIKEAERLMRTRPMDELTVSDITEAADVGHGTFYLHFKSKNEVLIPITRAIAARWDSILQQNFSELQDPAEIVALSVRHMGRAVVADPLWRWMLRHSGMPVDDIRGAIGRFATRDIQRGLETGRFQVADLDSANSFLVGGFVACLLASFDAAQPEKTVDYMTEFLLRTLGVTSTDAALIASQPLSPLATPSGHLS
jgi:AcrR family transcriptional regulator